MNITPPYLVSRGVDDGIGEENLFKVAPFTVNAFGVGFITKFQIF
jgi:hypothetical protein